MANKIRVGIIGANPNGSWGTRAHLPALSALEQFEVTAVATSHSETAAETARQFSITHSFGDPRKLVEHPDVDVVSVCIRVPYHAEMVAMALAAGKHVYCEWPLARNTGEAQKLLDLANSASSVTQIGLQARHAPALLYARDLIREGLIGNLHSIQLNHSVDWMPVLPSSLSYLQDFDSGAHMLSIPGGHSLDTLRWLAGDITELSAMVATRVEDVLMVDTGKTITRTSPDQVLVNATTGDGVLISLRVQGSSPLGSGVTLECNGDKGDLIVKCGPGARGIQMSDLTLYKTVAGGELERIEVPEHYFGVAASIRSNPALNVAKSYLSMAQAIQQGEPVPDFTTALSLHQLLDNIMASSMERKFTTGKSHNR